MRLHLGLMKDGIDSKFVCLKKFTAQPAVIEYHKRKQLNVIQRLLQKLGYSFLKEKKNAGKLAKYGNKYELFTFPETDIDLLALPELLQADIVNLHWVDYFLDYPSFFKTFKKPVVWTLHDKNPLMGGFHILGDKIANPEMADLEEKVWKRKMSYIRQHKNINIVSPSKFLFTYSEHSKTFDGYIHYNIPNSVDTNIFINHDKTVARKYFNFPAGKTLVLFLNSHTWHKGTDMIYTVLGNKSYNNLHFIGLGNEAADTDQITYLPLTYNERELSILYAAADFFLLPSREDNLPNMMLESLSCGTPVIGTPIGGIPDVVRNGINGILAKDDTAEAIAAVLEEINNNLYQFDHSKIRAGIVEKFGISVQSKKYRRLYSSILQQTSLQ